MRRTALLAIVPAVMLLAGGAGTAAAQATHPGYAKAATCSPCHGFAGASRSDAMPILAGMNADYMKKALADYAAGKRVSPEMEPFAKQAAVLGVNDIAAYFASQPKVATPIAADPVAIARGKTAAAQCAGCHGPQGKGDPAKRIPDLTGQPSGYLRQQMLLFKQDRRSPGDEQLKPIKALMKPIADGTFADLAAFYSSQR